MSDTPSGGAGKSIMPSWVKGPQDFVGGVVLCAVAIFARKKRDEVFVESYAERLGKNFKKTEGRAQVPPLLFVGKTCTFAYIIGRSSPNRGYRSRSGSHHSWSAKGTP